VVEDLVADDARHFEALLAGDRVDNHVAMDANEVLRVEDAILILRRDVLLALFLSAPTSEHAKAPVTRCGRSVVGRGDRDAIAGSKENLKVPGPPYR
jgi:hypothetical protein